MIPHLLWSGVCFYSLGFFSYHLLGWLKKPFFHTNLETVSCRARTGFQLYHQGVFCNTLVTEFCSTCRKLLGEKRFIFYLLLTTVHYLLMPFFPLILHSGRAPQTAGHWATVLPVRRMCRKWHSFLVWMWHLCTILQRLCPIMLQKICGPAMCKHLGCCDCEWSHVFWQWSEIINWATDLIGFPAGLSFFWFQMAK